MLVNVNAFRNILSRVYTSRSIEECVLEGKKEFIFIHAVDLSNSLVVFVKDKCGLKLKKPIGLGNISFMLDSLKRFQGLEVEAKIENDRFIFEHKQNKVSFLLATPETIPTNISTEEECKKLATIKDDPVYTLKISNPMANNLFRLNSLYNKGGIIFHVSPEKGWVTRGLRNEHQISIDLGGATYLGKGKKISFEVAVHHKLFVSILKEVLLLENGVTLILKPECALTFKIDDDNFWILAPITK